MPRKLITDSYRGWYGREDHTSSIYRISNNTVWDCRHKMDLEKFRLQTTVQRLDDTMKFQQQVQTKEYKTVRDEYSRILAEQKVFQMHAFQHYDTALTKGSNPEPPNHSSKRPKRPKTEMSLVSKSAEDRTGSEGPFNRNSFPSVNGRENIKTTKKLPRVRSAEKINSDSSTDDLTSRNKKAKKNVSKGKIVWDSETNKGDASQSDWPTKQTEVTKQTEAEEKLARAKLSRMSSKEKSFFLTQSDIMTSTMEEEENEEEEGVTTQTHRKDRTRLEHKLQTDDDDDGDLLPSVREGHKPRSDSFQHIQYILDEKHSTIPVGVKSTVPTDVKCMGPTHIPKKTIPSTVTDQKQISQERYKVPPLQLHNSKNSSMTNSSLRQSPRTTVVVSGSESSKAEAVHSGALFSLGRHHGAQKNSTSKEDHKSKTVREESEPLTAEKRSLVTMDRIKSNTGVQENSGPNAEEDCRVVPSSEVQPSLSVVKPEEASSKAEASSTKAVVILPSAKASLLSGLLSVSPNKASGDSSRVENTPPGNEATFQGAPRSGKPSLLSLSGKLSASPQASGTDSSRVENTTAVIESAVAPRSGKPSLLSLSGKLSASSQASGTDSSRVENTPHGNEATFQGAPRSGKPSLLSLSGKLSASPQASSTDSSRVENTPAVIESAVAPRSGKPSLLSLSGKLSASPQASSTDSSRVENTPPGNEATFQGAPRSGKPSLLSLSGKLSASPQASGTDSSRVENTPAVIESAVAPRSGKPSLLSLSGKLSSSPQAFSTDSSRFENTPPGNDAASSGAPRPGKPSLLARLQAKTQSGDTEGKTVDGQVPAKKSLLERFRQAADVVAEEQRVERETNMSVFAALLLNRPAQPAGSRRPGRVIEKPAALQAEEQKNVWNDLLMNVQSAVKWKAKKLRESQGILTQRQMMRKKQEEQEHKRRERPHILPGHTKTTYAMKKFLAQEVDTLVQAWKPENLRRTRNRRLVERTTLPQFVDRVRSTTTILREFKSYQQRHQADDVTDVQA